MIRLRVADYDTIDKRTVAERWKNLVTQGQYATSTIWKWKGGDAITVILGRGANTWAYFIIRNGKKIRGVEARNLKEAMSAVGLKAENFTTDIDAKPKRAKKAR